MRRCLRLFSITVFCAHAAVAHAGEREKAFAEALFEAARTLLEAGRIAEACSKLAESQRLEAKLGTLLNLATCHETEGKTASAWAEFVEALAQAERARQPERVEFAKEHVAVLEPKLSRITVKVADTEATVRIDGVVLERSAIDSALPLDPGEHEIVVSAPKKRAWTSRIVVAQGPSLDHVDIGALEDEPAAPPLVPPIPSSRVTSQPPPSTLGLVMAGVGVLGVGVGAYTGVRAFGLNADGERECVGSRCTQAGLDRLDDARGYATASTIAFSVGIVALAAGAYFLFFAERGEGAR